MRNPTDCQLLARFVADRDEAAFSTLTRRHEALVLRVCRRVLRDEHEAEDISQATFLVLARKALVLPCQQSVGPWLSAVAHRLALHARGARFRRREQTAGLFAGSDEEGPELVVPGGDPVVTAGEQELFRLMHEELSELPTKYRLPVVLCYLEGKTNEQAARKLGWPIGSISRRLEKARQLLRQRLTHRGYTLLTLLLCATMVVFWLARSLLPVGGPGPAPGCFQAAGEEQPRMPRFLRELAEGPPNNCDREQVVALAAESERIAERLEHREPGRLRADWQRLAQEMGTAARRLGDAAKSNDRPSTLLAASRLQTACVRCHETFRD